MWMTLEDRKLIVEKPLMRSGWAAWMALPPHGWMWEPRVISILTIATLQEDPRGCGRGLSLVPPGRHQEQGKG